MKVKSLYILTVVSMLIISVLSYGIGTVIAKSKMQNSIDAVYKDLDAKTEEINYLENQLELHPWNNTEYIGLQLNLTIANIEIKKLNATIQYMEKNYKPSRSGRGSSVIVPGPMY